MGQGREPLKTELPEFPGVAAWVRDLVGQEVSFDVADGGASRVGVVVSDLDGCRRWFLRIDDGTGGMSGTGYDLASESELLTRLARTTLPVPAVVGSRTDPPAMLMDFVEGSTELGDDLGSVAAHFMRLLAEIHRLDPRISARATPAGLAEAVRTDLEWWAARTASPALSDDRLCTLAVEVLDGTFPDLEGPAAFLHGDPGPGNFLAAHGEVTAVLDWEMSHLGHPLEDLAWIWVRSVHSPFGSFADRVAEYAASSGVHVDAADLQWFKAFVLAKTVIAMSLASNGGCGPSTVYFRSSLLMAYRALLARALSSLSGQPVELLARHPQRQRTMRSDVCDSLVQSESDPGRRRILQYLALADEMSSWASEERFSSPSRSDGDGGPSARRTSMAAAVADADLDLYPNRHASRWVRAAMSNEVTR